MYFDSSILFIIFRYYCMGQIDITISYPFIVQWKKKYVYIFVLSLTIWKFFRFDDFQLLVVMRVYIVFDRVLNSFNLIPKISTNILYQCCKALLILHQIQWITVTRSCFIILRYSNMMWHTTNAYTHSSFFFQNISLWSMIWQGSFSFHSIECCLSKKSDQW